MLIIVELSLIDLVLIFFLWQTGQVSLAIVSVPVQYEVAIGVAVEVAEAVAVAVAVAFLESHYWLCKNRI